MRVPAGTPSNLDSNRTRSSIPYAVRSTLANFGAKGYADGEHLKLGVRARHQAVPVGALQQQLAGRVAPPDQDGLPLLRHAPIPPPTPPVYRKRTGGRCASS